MLVLEIEEGEETKASQNQETGRGGVKSDLNHQNQGNFFLLEEGEKAKKTRVKKEEVED